MELRLPRTFMAQAPLPIARNKRVGWDLGFLDSRIVGGWWSSSRHPGTPIVPLLIGAESERRFLLPRGDEERERERGEGGKRNKPPSTERVKRLGVISE